jgi:hypothetical protein
MAWFFRAIETAQGRWECHHGARVFDEHLTLADALEHLRAIVADQEEAAQVFVHTLDGRVRGERSLTPHPAEPDGARTATWGVWPGAAHY